MIDNDDASYVHDPHMLFGVADELDASGKPFSAAKVRGMAEELVQARAVFAALRGVPDRDLNSLSRSFRSRAHGVALDTADIGEAFSAVVAESQSDDPMVKVGQMIGRALAFRQMFESEASV